MTRTAPLLTLVAVALAGGALLTTNYLSTPTAPVPVVAGAGTVPEPVGAAGTVPEPASPAPAAATTYAGWTAGMDFTVALAVTGEDVVAYVCDGEEVEVWLTGSLSDGDLALENADGTATLTGTAAADGAAGTVERDGARWSFTAEPMGVDDAAAAGRGDVRQVAERAAGSGQAPAVEAAVEQAPTSEAAAEEAPVEQDPSPEYPESGYPESGYPGSEY